MNGDSKNESFKLLQLSDDSKSLSDLELPEIVNQRKRKVRRKTRPRTTSARHDDDHRIAGANIDCKNFGLWLAVMMTVMWLFIISYITSVVHSENRRLEIAIQKVSATSQNVPEALQKWHETSKNLEQNQTALNGKLREIQQVLDSFSTELKQLRDTIEKKNENSQETQLINLNKNVADLGSKITDTITQVTLLQEFKTKVKAEQEKLQETVAQAQMDLAEIKTHLSSVSVNGSKNDQFTDAIANIRSNLTAQIDDMSKNFTSELPVLNQKIAWLENDRTLHKKSIDALQDSMTNISSHVKSVENIWVEMKANLTSLDDAVRLLDEDLLKLHNTTNSHLRTINMVSEQCDRNFNYNTELNRELKALKERLLEKEVTATVATTTTTTTEKAASQADKNGIPNKLVQLFDYRTTEAPDRQWSMDALIAPASRPPASAQQPTVAPSTASTSTTTTAASPSSSKKAEPSLTGGGGM